MRRRTHNFRVKRQGGIPILPLPISLSTPVLPSIPLGGITPILSIPSSSLPIPVKTSTTTDTSTSSIPSSSSGSSSDSSTISTPTPTPISTPTVSQTVFETTSDGTVHTITTYVDSVPSPTRSVIPPPPPKSFLQNKALSGVVFSLIGIIGFALIIAIVTFIIRRRRNSRLLKDAISFDPASTTDAHHPGFREDRGSLEKRSVLTRSNDNSVNPSENNPYSMTSSQGHKENASYPYGPGPNSMGSTYPKPPPVVMPEYVHDPNRVLPMFPRSEGINWGPSLTSSTGPSASPDPYFPATTDGRTESQNRLLKVTNI